jgi:hypothetical protein
VTRAALAGCVLLGIHGVCAAQADTWTLGSGILYSTGDYGTSTQTSILWVPLHVRHDRAQWTLRATIAYLEVDGASSVIPGVGPVNNANPRRRGGGAAATGAGRASGIGDVVLSATHRTYYDPARQLGLDLTGRVKLPTADEDEGLGTGETDLGFQADAYKGFGRVTAFAGLGYTLFGSSPAIPLRDVFNVTLGASYRLDQQDSVGIAYDQRDPVARGAGELSEVTLFWSRQLDQAWKTQAYFLLGLEDGSPDWGAGLTAAYAF